MDSLCREMGITGSVVTHSSTPPLLDAVFHVDQFGLNERTPEFSATFLDPAPLLLDTPESDRYRADIDGVSIYFDDDHLTKKASVALLLPLLREAMGDKLVAIPQAKPR